VAAREPYVSRFTQGTARHDDYYDDLLPSPPAGNDAANEDDDAPAAIDTEAYAAARQGFLRAQLEQKSAAVSWTTVLHDAVGRGDGECAICMSTIDTGPLRARMGMPSPDRADRAEGAPRANERHTDTAAPGSPGCASHLHKRLVLLSCSHLFHAFCIQNFERYLGVDAEPSCPVCRSSYSTKTL
jgi:hypothetical protein